MGFFDRWRKSSVRRYEFEDNPFAQRSVERPFPREDVRTRRSASDNWLWLLLIPLFLLLGLGAYSYLSNTSLNGFTTTQPNFLSNLFNRDNDTGQDTNNGNSGLQFGVGGAPTTPTPTLTPTPTQQAEEQSNTTTESDQESGRVQSASDRRIPSVAPSTGRGR